MKFFCLTVVAFCLGAALGCEDFPHETDTKLFWKLCDDDPGLVSAQNVSMFDDDGNKQYPIDVTKPLTMIASVNNKAGTLKNFYVSASVARRNTFLTCNWIPLPTFGLVSNLNPCDFGATCPMLSGAQEMRVRFDFARFGPLVNIMPVGMPYKITLRFYNKDDNDKLLGCVVTESKIQK